MQNLPSGTSSVQAGYYTVTRTVAAGAVSIVDLTGNYVHCLSSNLASFLISIDGGPSQFMAAQIKVKTPIGTTFRQVIIDNTQNGNPLIVTLAIGLGDITDSRIPASVDPLDTLALQGQAFFLNVGAAAVAAQFQMVGWSNQGTKNVFVRYFELNAATTVAVLMMPYTVAGGQGSTTKTNKFIGGAAPTCFGEFTNSVTQNLNGTVASTSRAFTVAANVTLAYTPKSPIIIPPGQRLGLFAQTVNIQIGLNSEITEQ